MNFNSNLTGAKQIQTAKALATQISSLYRTSMICFINQTAIHANKNQNQNLKNKPIGQLPEYFEDEKDPQFTADDSETSNYRSAPVRAEDGAAESA